jgi:hypothetical protein
MLSKYQSELIELTKIKNDLISILKPFGLDLLDVEQFGRTGKMFKMIIPFQKKNHYITYPVHDDARTALINSGFRITMEQGSKRKGMIYILVKA